MSSDYICEEIFTKFVVIKNLPNKSDEMNLCKSCDKDSLVSCDNFPKGDLKILKCDVIL